MILPHVLVSRTGLPGRGVERLAEHAVLRYPRGDTPDASQLRAEAAGVSAILCLGTDTVDSGLLDAAGPDLRVVALASMGFDRVDREAAADRGVVVCHTPGILTETTADLAFALMMMTRRRLVHATDSLRAGKWDYFRMTDYLGLDVHGQTLGIVGYGQIGRAVARRARGFGMKVIYHASARDDTESTSVELPVLLSESDIVSLHVPLTPRTRGLIGAPELALMKPTATLINTARGGIVDEVALLDALSRGQLHSAGLDVFEVEPVGRAVERLVADSRLVCLPHIGSATERTRAAMIDLAADNILDVLAGRPARTALPGTRSVPGSPAEQAI